MICLYFIDIWDNIIVSYKFINFLKMYLASKLSKYVVLAPLTYNAIQWVTTDSYYILQDLLHMPSSFILGNLSLKQKPLNLSSFW